MKKILISLIILCIASQSKADEGMWMLNTLNQSNWERMKELGFKLSEDQLYSENKPSLKDAVVHFDGGCTGITVSGKGLIFTNHHCGFDAIQSQSSIEHDYLKDGFIAQTQQEETPIPGMFVKYLLRTEDVTQQIMDSVKNIEEEIDRISKIQDVIKNIEDSVSNTNKFIEAIITSYYNGNSYYLNVYEVFNDIRMVFAPPSSVGKFGGDTDNWMWPRHTGDFSVFRVYANKENNPAGYSEENIPYSPRYYVPVSLKGYNEKDYAMTIGFPGSTDRYLSSWGIKQRISGINKPVIEVRGIKQEIWKEAMLNSDDARIKYASKYARSSNFWKNSIGMNRGIERMHVIERKENLEKQFSEWVSQDPQRKAFYGEALDLIKESFKETDDMQQALFYLYETLLAGTEINRLSFMAMKYDVTETPENQQKFLEEELQPIYKDYLPELDQKVLAAMLKVAKDRVPELFLPRIYKEIDKKYKGDYDKYAADLFKKSVVPDFDQLKEILKDPKKVKKLDKDPAYQLATSIREALDATMMGVRLFHYDQIKGERLYFAGLKQMMPNRNFAADANSTMRMSYGSISGYNPYDGAWYDYFTTENGVFEKYDVSDPDFDVQPEILALLKSKDFGKYGSNQGHMNLCFLSDNDITGGNSGSPVFNGNGQLIGLAFDGNWEAMSGDIAFEPEIQKTISVDIRYVMFMIEKWGKCNRLIEEISAN